jgi:hypothetical protein
MDFLFVWIIKLLHVDSSLVIVEKAKIKDRTEDNALQVHLGNLLKQKSTVTFAFSVSLGCDFERCRGTTVLRKTVESVHKSDMPDKPRRNVSQC